jgi:hypothetical protein
MEALCYDAGSQTLWFTIERPHPALPAEAVGWDEEEGYHNFQRLNLSL